MRLTEEEFERELARSLRRVDAPMGLAGKVMARAARGSKMVRLSGFPLRHGWAGSVAAALLVGALLVGGVEHRLHVRDRERAERDFARSMEITDRVMEQTRQRLQRAGVALDD